MNSSEPVPWSSFEARFLKRFYGGRSDAALAESLGRTALEVADKATRMRLAKNKRAFPGQARQPRWSHQEVTKLRRYHTEHSNREIAIVLGRSERSVNTKARRLGLRKSSKYKSALYAENASAPVV